jgi:hypothetical protein
MDPELNFILHDLADRLWDSRNKKITRKTIVDGFPFKTSDGQDGYVKVVINPRLSHLGQIDTKPTGSRDPADFVLEVQPKHYVSRKNLYLTLYHEMLHATDPSQSTKYDPKYMLTYDEKSDEKYWGHPFEFRTISNEFLEGLEMEIERRLSLIKNPDYKKYLIQSIENILRYFAEGQPLTKLSLDILRRVNDEEVLENMINKSLTDLTSINPGLSDFISAREGEEPYYLTYIELVKKYNKKMWPRFLTMLFKSLEDLKVKIQQKNL